MKDRKILTMTYAAMFAALCCVATMMIRVPTIGTQGYVNIGDTIVLLSAWMLGGVWGALAAGVGSGLADLLAGYPVYVPGTFVIKFCMAFAAWAVCNSLGEKTNKSFSVKIISAIIAEAIMIIGYFLYESTLLGYGLAAAASIPSNGVQGGTCLILGLAAIQVLQTVLKGRLVNVRS